MLPLALLCFAPSLAESSTPPAKPRIEFSAGARMFLRPQARTRPTLGRPGPDESWSVPQSARLNGGFRYGPLGITVQLQDVRTWGDETTQSSVDPFTGAHQAYVEVADDGFGPRGRFSGFLRAGRQEVVLWTQRLLGNAPWAPGQRAFDAARGRIEYGPVGFELGASVLRSARTLEFENDDGMTTRQRASGDHLYWAEATAQIHSSFELHAAALVLRQGAADDDPGRDRALLTPGGYVHGELLTGLTYDVEAYGQLGRDGPLRHRAWAAAATVTYSIPVRLDPLVRGGYETASGSTCREAPESGNGCDNVVERDFEQFYGSRHRWRGFSDLFGLSNVGDLFVRGALSPASEVTFSVDYHWLRLQQARGRWRDIGGNLVGTGWDPDNDNATVGHELDAVVSYRPWTPLHLRPGYSVFLPAGAGTRFVGERAQHFVYLWLIAEIGHRWIVR